MLIDMHAHTSGISCCCRANAEEVLRTARKAGIDGLVLTNHYQEAYLSEDGAAGFSERYIAEYRRTEEIAVEMGIRLFFGVEVTARRHDNAHILLYGVAPEFVREHPEIYDYPLNKMYSAVHECGGLLVQAHPFRSGGHILDTAFLDGIEINCHPIYDATHCERLLNIAEADKIIVTCGGDYHADTYRAVCGTYFPDDVCDNAGLVAYLKNTREIKLHVHELRTEEHHDVIYQKQIRTTPI